MRFLKKRLPLIGFVCGLAACFASQAKYRLGWGWGWGPQIEALVAVGCMLLALIGPEGRSQRLEVYAGVAAGLILGLRIF
jgi:hypothetical protein